MKRITVSLSESILDQLDKAVEEKRFSNRSEFIRYLFLRWKDLEEMEEVPISIPESMLAELDKKVKSKGFNSRSELIRYVYRFWKDEGEPI